MFDYIVRHGILVTVTVLIIAILGILSAIQIPVQMIPDLDVRTISIRTNWPGATPQDVEKEIIIEQEEYLRNIPYLQKMQSTANFASAEIELDFPFGVDLNETLIRVNNALTQVPNYPENVDEPSVFATSFSDNAFMYFRVSPLEGNPRELDMDMMRDYVEDNVRPRMSGVAGVSEVSVGSGAERQIQIHLDPARLAERDLTPMQVRDAIRERNRDISGGEIESGKRRYLLRTMGRFESIEDLQNLILERNGDSVTYLSDVAEVTLDHFKIRNKTYINGRPVISLQVRRESGSNVIAIKEAMMKEVELINAELLQPQGMTLELTADDVGYVQSSIFNVWKNLILGALLATGIMYVFLRSIRTTALGIVGIPICTIAAFLGLLLAGRTINVISLAGVAFAIGMTLDNSIVVLESIVLERRKGLSKLRAAVSGVQKVWPAVLASTLTTVMVFLPVVFIVEEAGQLYSDIAIAISASILASMLVAITVIPAASARLSDITDGETPDSETEDTDSTNSNSTAHAKRRGWQTWITHRVETLIATNKKRWMTAIITIVASAAIILFLTPPAEYLPEGEEARTFSFMNAPPGYNLETMDEIALELQEFLVPHLNADPKEFAEGKAEVPALKFFLQSVSPQSLMIIAESRDPTQVDALMEVLVQRYESYPGMRAFATRGSIISSNDGGTRSVNLDISGANLADLFSVAQSAYARAEEIFENPNIQTQPGSLSLTQPLLQVLPDWRRASELELTTEDVGFTVASLTDGAFVNEFFMADDKIDIYLYNQDGPGADLDTLQKIAVYVPGHGTLPLSDFAKIVEKVDTASIRRQNGRRTVTLNIIPPRSVALETGVAMVRKDIVKYLQDSGQVPTGVTLNISGAADQLDATKSALSSNYLVALAIVYLLMVAIFSHWGYPLLILTTIPLGIAGGIAGLAVLNVIGVISEAIGFGGIKQPFDMISMLGFLILMGTVVNNPILIVHSALSNLHDEAMAPVDAVREAVHSRLRPIAISTITTIAGLAPLVFLPGAGSELYRGVGVIVLGGIIGATLVTLTMLPALTVMVLDWSQTRSHRKENIKIT